MAENGTGAPLGATGADVKRKRTAEETAMANELAPQTTSLPPWFVELERLTAWTSQAGTIHLRAGTNYSEGQRQATRDHAARLRSSLRSATELELSTELAVLLAGYPAHSGLSAASQDLRLEAFIRALSGFPRWAVADACRMWSRGENAEPTDRHGFAPSPPQLVRLAKLATEPTEKEIRRLSTMAEAVVDAAPELSADQNRRAAPAPPETVTWAEYQAGVAAGKYRQPVTSRFAPERAAEPKKKGKAPPATSDAEIAERLAKSAPAKLSQKEAAE